MDLQTLSRSCPSPDLPSFFFCQVYPSLRKYLRTLRLNSNKEPPIVIYNHDKKTECVSNVNDRLLIIFLRLVIFTALFLVVRHYKGDGAHIINKRTE